MFKVHDEVKIQANSNMSGDDISVLTLLYQPLIGAKAYSLFLAMYHLVDRKTLSTNILAKSILDITGVTIDAFEDEMNILQGIGLVDVYSSKDNFIFDLNQPLSASQFIKDGSLGVYLYSEIGDTEFQRLTKQFEIAHEISKKYKNITKSFDEVFTKTGKSKRITGSYINRENTGYLTFKNNFDFKRFLAARSNYVDSSKIDDKLKENILKLAFTYGLNEEDMVNCYVRSLDSAGNFDYSLFPREVRRFYQFKMGDVYPKIRMDKTKSGDEFIDQFTNNTPAEFLSSRSGMPAAASDLDIIFKLISINKLSPEVVNVLVHYVLKVNFNKMPGYEYFAKIANEWGRVGIKNVEDAIKYISVVDKPKPYFKDSAEWSAEYKKDKLVKDEKEALKDKEKYKDVDYIKAYEIFKKL